ncbi:glycosyltransferase family 4 protein [Spirosoma radiotolerans]|uniref:Group 1 glycosyl transferase n=1 Tax=Spirosoma radiotolerans TaxID=1379870 RepID=A0A0E3ZYD3_9BACT|nr:glycosyltransferase family 1 protein [Spirosoma radiotolerans]AKD56943.1 group 1 glycosyl transferase [Spirosoma radiotolerans]
MTVLYLFRSPGTGYSIDQLFDSVRVEVAGLGVNTQAIRLPYVSRGLRPVWQNLRFIKQLTADLFHITGDIHYAALALPASRTILTIHDCFLLTNNRKRPVRYLIFWLLWYYLPIRRAGVVTAVSENTRQELIRYVGRIAHKVQVVPNGYDPLFTHRPRAFMHQQPRLLQLGTARHKNVARLMAAIEAMPCMLLIVGSLTDKLIAELQQRQIQYRQYVSLPKEQVVELYNESDIITFISTQEGFGLPILEANAVGRVVITARVSPMQELAADAAHLVDPTDIAAIRMGIERLIQDDTYRQTLIDAGLKNAQQYTINRAAERYKVLYDQQYQLSHVYSPTFL